MSDLHTGTPTRALGAGAVVFSALYLLSDVIEATQGGFSTGQLWLTLVVEMAIPFFVIGIALVQRPRLGRLGSYSAVGYAYAYVFFTGTVVYALVNGTGDFSALDHDLRPWMTIHGGVMVFAGLGLGLATIRAAVLPRWTGAVLMAGVVLVAMAEGLPQGVQVVAAGVRDLGFAGMGVALMRTDAASGKRRLGSPVVPRAT